MIETLRKRCLFSNTSLPLIVLAMVIAGLLSACTSTKNLQYFTNLSNSQIVKLPAIGKPQSLIMNDDLLDIRIAGANEETAKLLNTYSTGSINAAAGSTGETTYPLLLIWWMIMAK